MSLLTQINKEDFDKVIAYSQNIPAPQTSELLENWSRAKQDIVSRFLNGKINIVLMENKIMKTHSLVTIPAKKFAP